METRRSTARSTSSHGAWRRLAKRERRRRLRREAARERDDADARLRAALERSAGYSNWRAEQERLEEEREERERQDREERERLWLETEVKAQKEWVAVQERKARARQQQLAQEAKIRAEFEAKREAMRNEREAERRRREEEVRKREELRREIDGYIDDGDVKTPEVLREVIDSQPGKELCPFFAKTAACRYGESCSRNHRRVCLSRVILVPGFYSHFSLEKNAAEYDTDVGLEYESSETRRHFREFYRDVVPELESYGRIRTLKVCCNSEVHLRGNLYAEYGSEREAARALRALKGRWYAGRQLNCEFANLQSWRSAVCGMQKCPKGRACNFLHVLRNPRDEYGIKSPPRRPKHATPVQETAIAGRRSKWEDSVRDEHGDERGWRWSESPEPEPKAKTKTKTKTKTRPVREKLALDASDRRRRRRRRRRRSPNGKSRRVVRTRESRESRESSEPTARVQPGNFWDQRESEECASPGPYPADGESSKSPSSKRRKVAGRGATDSEDESSRP